MTKRSVVWGLALVCATAQSAIFSPAAAQDYLPVAKEKTLGERITPNILLQRAGIISMAVAPPLTTPAADPFTCSSPPAVSELQTSISSKTVSSAMAASLGFAPVSVSGSSNSTVLIQDWTRSKPCLSTDGKTQLMYGQAVRVIASIAEIDASANLTLATIAAQATLNNKASSVQATLVGVEDQASNILAASLLGPLNVENFGTKSSVIESIAKKVVESTTDRVEFLGVVPSQQDVRLDIATAFGVQQIAKGRTCLAAKSRLATGGVDVAAALEGVYVNLTGTCGATSPNAVMRATAAAALMGLEIKD